MYKYMILRFFISD